MATRSSRPSGIVVVHQAPPAVAAIITRSPSRRPLSRNATTAALARCVFSGRHVDVVEDDDERAPRQAGRGVRRDAGRLRRARPRSPLAAGSSGGVDHLEVDERLRRALVEHGEVLAREAGASGCRPCRVTTTSTVTTSTSRLKVGGASWLAAEAASESGAGRRAARARASGQQSS